MVTSLTFHSQPELHRRPIISYLQTPLSLPIATPLVQVLNIILELLQKCLNCSTYLWSPPPIIKHKLSKNNVPKYWAGKKFIRVSP